MQRLSLYKNLSPGQIRNRMSIVYREVTDGKGSSDYTECEDLTQLDVWTITATRPLANAVATRTEAVRERLNVAREAVSRPVNYAKDLVGQISKVRGRWAPNYE